jgi:hypothetical protein
MAMEVGLSWVLVVLTGVTQEAPPPPPKKKEQAVPSFDAESLEWLESIHDKLQSLQSIAQSVSPLHIMLVISMPSRWEERGEGEGGHDDCEGHWFQEEAEA